MFARSRFGQSRVSLFDIVFYSIFVIVIVGIVSVGAVCVYAFSHPEQIGAFIGAIARGAGIDLQRLIN